MGTRRVADGELEVRCRGKNGKCNRPLRTPESQRRGIGPVCEDREMWMAGADPTYPRPEPRPRGPRRRRPAQTGLDLLDLLREGEASGTD